LEMVISTRSCKPRETRRSCHLFTETQSARRCGQCHSYSAAHTDSGGAELLSQRPQTNSAAQSPVPAGLFGERALADVIEAYEAKRWPSGKVAGGKASGKVAAGKG
jgi:hypothetical protein